MKVKWWRKQLGPVRLVSRDRRIVIMSNLAAGRKKRKKISKGFVSYPKKVIGLSETVSSAKTNGQETLKESKIQKPSLDLGVLESLDCKGFFGTHLSLI